MSTPLTSDVLSSRSNRLLMGSPRQAAVSTAPMQLLLVGDNEDSSYLRNLLNGTGNGHVGLDHAHSAEEALVRLGQATYDLLLCEYKSEDGAALRLLHELRRNGAGAPVIFSAITWTKPLSIRP